MDQTPLLVSLAGSAALDPAVAGAKAANLARCADAGLPTLPGMVLTTAAIGRGRNDEAARRAMRTAWDTVSLQGRRPVVVRSSSTVEDAASSSMAGRFTSVIDVTDWERFCSAVDAVVESAQRVDGHSPMAVLVQPRLDVRVGGVMFGVDPMSGRRRTIAIEVVRGGPHSLVDGTAIADHLTITRRGRLIDRRTGDARVALGWRQRRRLARAALDAEKVFGSPQDLEWAIGADGRFVVLQSRPVTAVPAEKQPGARRWGAGPVAETFPVPLTTLERELWLGPLRDGIADALRASRAVPPRELDRSPVAITVAGRVVVDLDLLGVLDRHERHAWRHPWHAMRRLGAAWTIGTLRAELPRRVAALVDDVDRWLESTGPLESLSDRDLAALLVAAREWLTVVHADEVSSGILLAPAEGPPSLARCALDVWEATAAAGAPTDVTSDVTSDVLLAEHPVLLALQPPAIVGERRGTASRGAPNGGGIVEREAGGEAGTARVVDRTMDLAPRDALRLRIRWLHELQVRTAHELGGRFSSSGRLASCDTVAHLHLGEVEEMAADERATVDPDDVAVRADRWQRRCRAPSLPTAFRLDGDDRVVPVDLHGAERAPTDRSRIGAACAGTAASRGRAAGVVVHDPADLDGCSTSAVLVVEHLDPALATVLPRVAAIVSETGSVLSHLAILAREAHVPAVVAVDSARRRLAAGRQVVVDGDTGRIELVADPGHRPTSGRTVAVSGRSA